MPDAAVVGTVQLRYKVVDEYYVDVSIWKAIVADDPVPVYVAITYELIVPEDVLLPIAFTIEPAENAHEELGMLKY